MLGIADWPLMAVGFGWSMFWVFALCSSVFQLLSIVAKPRIPAVREGFESSVAVLYVTCDDFNCEACESCFSASRNSNFVICDDSSRDEIKAKVDEWALRNDVGVIRRENRIGFKAGNLNYAIRECIHDDFILICDADERLSDVCIPRYLDYFIDDQTAFVQAAHSEVVERQSWYARAMGPSITLLFQFCLPSHDRFGFVSCYGHGVMFRRSAWEDIGGFPEVTSEDLAFALECRVHGYSGRFAADIVATEEHPASFESFSKKYRKIVRGTIEVLHLYTRRILRCRHIRWYEKLDFLITFSFCYIPLLICVNAVASLLYFHDRDICELSTAGHLVSTIGPLTPLIPFAPMLLRSPGRWLWFLLIGGISYSSILPTLSLEALRGILHISNRVWVPSGSLTGQKYREHFLPVLSGLVFVAAAIGLRSAASLPIFILGGIMIVSPVVSVSNYSWRD